MDEINTELSLNTNLLDYLSGVPPKKSWELRGLKGHDGAAETAYNMTFKSARSFIRKFSRDQDSKTTEKIRGFLRRIIRIYRGLLSAPDKTLSGLVGDRKLYLVSGFYRSGGTYLLDHILRSGNMDIKSFTRGMVHDGCPSKIKLPAAQRLNESPKKESLLELAQWLAWAEERFAKQNFLAKKSTALGKIIPFLAESLGDKLEIIFHYRHPFPTLLSYYDYRGKTIKTDRNNLTEPAADLNNHLQGFTSGLLSIPTDRYNSFSPLFKLTVSWISYHSQLLSELDRIEKSSEINFLEFGPDHETFVRKFRKTHNPQLKIRSFQPRKRSIPGEYFQQPIAKKLTELEEKWRDMNLKFPAAEI